MRWLSFACGVAALWLCLWIVDRVNVPRFELVSYYAQGATLEAETLDSGLSAQDCAYALEVAERGGVEVLLTCERER